MRQSRPPHRAAGDPLFSDDRAISDLFSSQAWLLVILAMGAVLVHWIYCSAIVKRRDYWVTSEIPRRTASARI